MLRAIAGTIPSTGAITIDENNVTFVTGPDRRISMAWQDSRLLPNKTALENVLINGADIDTIHQYAKILKIEHVLAKLPHELSGGEQQRVNILRAVSADVQVVLLDEPMQGVDNAVVRKIMSMLLTKLKSCGKIAVVVTHDLAQSYGLFDNVVIVKGGDIVYCGKYDDVYHNPATPWVANFFGPYSVLHKDQAAAFGYNSSILIRPEWIS